jgi:hypothetical protein
MKALIIIPTRREDRALLGSNPSAQPGAEAWGEAAVPRLPLSPLFTSWTCFGPKAQNPPSCFSTPRFPAPDVTNVNIGGALMHAA